MSSIPRVRGNRWDLFSAIGLERVYPRVCGAPRNIVAPIGTYLVYPRHGGVAISLVRARVQ